MEILINDQKLDFKLENEKTLKDIVAGIEDWLRKEDLCITAMRHGKTDLLAQPQNLWEELPLSDIDVLNLEIQSYSQLRYSSLSNFIDFTRSFKKAVVENNTKEIKDLIEGYPFLTEGLNLLFQPEMFPDIYRHFAPLNTMLQDKNTEKGLAIISQNESNFLEALDGFHRILAQVLIESEEPQAALEKLTEQLSESGKAISEVAILLQTGKDKQAMEHLLFFSDVLQSLLRVFYMLKEKKHIDFLKNRIGDQSFEEFYQELNNKMRELIQAFDNNDSVLIGDLLEYEIAPQLENLVAFLTHLEVK
ncbi:MAG: hypothetical protein JXR70_17295 [Spirochaetales bacterium]|nr:hypothetical protein [Spirochaetales bacterium]